MKSADRNLGMDRPISRRDLLLGMGAAFDVDFYKRNGLTAGVYFDRETFGVDRISAFPLVNSLLVRGRKPFGRIAIGYSDAGSGSLIPIAQAHRAVSELV